MLVTLIAHILLRYCLNTLFLCASSMAFLSPPKERKPNFVLIVTDDQDSELFGMFPMTKTRQLLVDRGATFKNAFVTTPICCPSRASILSGLYASNHGTVNNSISGNCNGKRWQEEIEPKALPVHLQRAGYTTFFAGKYLNDYGRGRKGIKRVPPGWDVWNGLQGNSRYFNYTLSIDGKPEKHGSEDPDDYLTHVLTKKSLEFLSSYVNSTEVGGKPFFMMICPPAPHGPFTPEKRFKNEFWSVQAPRTPSFNVRSTSKHWLLRAAKWPMSDNVIALVDEVFRNRWRTLLSVDELVAKLVSKLEELSLMSNTFVFFTSDNGFHMGQFSLPWDKRQPYEFDIRVPMIVRGPGIRPDSRNKQIVLNIDIAPTILELTNTNDIAFHHDGRSFKNYLLRTNNSPRRLNQGKKRRSFLVEYWGEQNHAVSKQCVQLQDQGLAECPLECDCVCQDSWNNSYTCLRTIIPHKQNSLFCQFYDNELYEELYDLELDPYQLVRFHQQSEVEQQRHRNHLKRHKMQLHQAPKQKKFTVKETKNKLIQNRNNKYKC